MKIRNARIDLFFNKGGLEINLYDNDASVVFARVVMTPEQTCQAMGRRSMTECEIEVGGLHKVGLKMETATIEFEIPKDLGYNDRKTALPDLCALAMENEGLTEWTSDNYYSSQSTFFHRAGKHFARTTIRRWV